MGEKRGEQGGVRRYFAVDAAGSIAWRAEELVEREASRVRDREEWRIGKNRGVCVCACVVRVRVTGYEKERERGWARDAQGRGWLSWGEKDSETKSDSPTSTPLSSSFALHALLSLHPPPPLPPPDNPRSRCIQGRCYRQRTIHAFHALSPSLCLSLSFRPSV